MLQNIGKCGREIYRKLKYILKSYLFLAVENTEASTSDESQTVGRVWAEFHIPIDTLTLFCAQSSPKHVGCTQTACSRTSSFGDWSSAEHGSSVEEQKHLQSMVLEKTSLKKYTEWICLQKLHKDWQSSLSGMVLPCHVMSIYIMPECSVWVNGKFLASGASKLPGSRHAPPPLESDPHFPMQCLSAPKSTKWYKMLIEISFAKNFWRIRRPCRRV